MFILTREFSVELASGQEAQRLLEHLGACSAGRTGKRGRSMATHTSQASSGNTDLIYWNAGTQWKI